MYGSILEGCEEEGELLLQFLDTLCTFFHAHSGHSHGWDTFFPSIHLVNSKVSIQLQLDYHHFSIAFSGFQAYFTYFIVCLPLIIALKQHYVTPIFKMMKYTKQKRYTE